MNIDTISDRAYTLAGSMPHGDACFQACRESGVPEDELSSTAAIVSSIVTDREINGPFPKEEPVKLTDEQRTKIRRDQERLERQRAASRAANARRRGA